MGRQNAGKANGSSPINRNSVTHQPTTDNQQPKRHTQLVRPLGFEPRTCGLRVRCSAVELEAHRPSRS